VPGQADSGPLGSIIERAELDRLKSEFVWTVSHEPRPPLSSVLGYLELLRTDLTGEQLRIRLLRLAPPDLAHPAAPASAMSDS
jgi:signal transduction histidine kinase